MLPQDNITINPQNMVVELFIQTYSVMVFGLQKGRVFKAQTQIYKHQHREINGAPVHSFENSSGVR